MEVWFLIAIPVVSALTGLITTGVVMLVGGVGVLRHLNKRLMLLEDGMEDTNTRITKEVKRRAGEAGVAAKKGSAEQQAEEHLRNLSSRQPAGRPKVV